MRRNTPSDNLRNEVRQGTEPREERRDEDGTSPKLSPRKNNRKITYEMHARGRRKQVEASKFGHQGKRYE